MPTGAHHLLALIVTAAASRSEDGKHRDGLISRLATRATGRVVDIVDPDVIIDQVDVDALMQRVDVNALLDRVDPDIILDNVDVNRLMDRVDVNALLDRVDVDRLMGRVDVDAILDRVDVKELTDRAGIPDIVRESTSELAGSALDILRRQIVAIDQIVGRITYRMLGRDWRERPQSPIDFAASDAGDPLEAGQVTGHYAGPVSRLAAFAADAALTWLTFLLSIAAFAFAINFVLGVTLDTSWQAGLAGLALLSLWGFFYFWFGITIAGKTVGMAIVGLAVRARDGGPLSGKKAALRTVVMPASFLFFGLGLLGGIVSPERRTLHDVAGGSVVVYDWGDRPAEMPGPLAHWLDRHAGAEEVE
jgi:uncharacterized RDD family membrane protein YckC